MRRTVIALIFLSGCATPPPGKKDAAAPPEPKEASIVTTVAFTEGPTADAEGNVYFTETTSARIMKYSTDGKLSTFRADSNKANGLLFDAEFRLVACENGNPRVTRTDMKSGKVEVLADQYEGKQFNGPNDVTMDAKGRLYFTDPVPPGKEGTPAVYRIDAPKKVTRILSAPDIQWPNGITISPDDKTLYLVEANKVENGARMIRAFELAEDGTASQGRVFHNFYPGRSADGITIDSAGNVYAAAGLMRTRGTHETLDTRPGVYVFAPDGTQRSYTPVLEDTITNVAFGGPDLKTLYITAGKTLYQIKVDVAGTRR